MASSARLGLPFLSAGQAQKEVAHNESLQTLDSLVGCAVEQEPVNPPPASPAVGSCYMVGDAPTDAWAGNAHAIAAFTSGGWRFVAPFDGLTAYIRSSGNWAVYRAGAWEFGQLRGSNVVLEGQQVVGARLPAIASPVGGAVVDAEARSAIGQILAAMRQHGLIET
jgi:hypothetical protein